MVENGRQALEAWRARAFDLIFMDIHMPEMDGREAAAAIRREEAQIGRARTPIVALTANAMSHQAQEYLGIGMDGCVTKPIEASELLQAILRAAAT